MSSAVSKAKTVAVKGVSSVLDPMGLTSAITGIDVEDSLSSLAGIEEEASVDAVESIDPAEQLQADSTNAARMAEAAKKKKKTSSSVLTSPLGATSTAKTAVTKLGGM